MGRGAGSEPHAAAEIVQRVFLRLAGKLAAGRTYAAPYRVVVWQVVKWLCRGYEWTATDGARLPHEWEMEGADELAEWEGEHDFHALIADLPPREREVLDLVYREGLSPTQIAERLAIRRNAVDQAVWRGHRKVAEKLAG